MINRKTFSVQEANKRLPLIRQIVEEILESGKKVKALGLLAQTPSVKKEYQELVDTIESLIQELEDLGCHFKDWNFEMGLVDFPSVIDGENVLLCWRSDEERIAWYHSYDGGYPGRKPIPPELMQN